MFEQLCYIHAKFDVTFDATFMQSSMNELVSLFNVSDMCGTAQLFEECFSDEFLFSKHFRM